MRSRTFWLIAAVIVLLAYVAGRWAATYVTASPDPGDGHPDDQQQIAGSTDSVLHCFGFDKWFLNQSAAGRLARSYAHSVGRSMAGAAAEHQADANQSICC